jgi:hypothetical protein
LEPVPLDAGVRPLSDRPGAAKDGAPGFSPAEFGGSSAEEWPTFELGEGF